MTKQRHAQPTIRQTIHFLNVVKADALTGFVAGFLVGVMGMYLYVIILTSSPV